MAIAETSKGTDVSSAARTLAVNLKQLRWAMSEGLISAMKNPMANIYFGMAAATLSNGNIRGVISNAPAPR